MAQQKWVLVIDGDSTGAQGAVEGVSAKTIAMGNIMSDIAKGAAQALASAFGSLVNELGRSISAAAEAQKNQMTLAAAMQQAGTFTQAAFKANLDYASALQKVSIYGDDEINVVQKLLSNFGLEGEALNKATKATLDLAAAKGMDLASAGDVVAKSIGTSSNALKRYGIDVEESATKTERATQVVEGITKLFGGSAAAQTQSFSGRLKQLGNVYNDLQEEVGAVITNNKGLQQIFSILVKVIEDATKWVSEHKEMLAGLVKDGIIFVINAVGMLVQAVSFMSDIWTNAGNVLLKVFGGIISGIIEIVKAISIVYAPARAWVKSLEEMKVATEEEVEAGNKSRDERKAFFNTLIAGINNVKTSVKDIKVVYEETASAVDTFEGSVEGATETAAATTEELLALARGYTEAELKIFQDNKAAMALLLEEGKITQDEYYNYLSTAGKKFNDTDAKQMEDRKKNVQSTNAAIQQISNAAAQSYLSGQKSFGTALEDAAKASARAIIDTEIDKAIQSIGITEALETGKAALGGFLSFGATLLLIPLIAAAGAAAKAVIHGIVGFADGGIVGAGGTKLPLPSFASAGSGAPALVMAHAGEAIGTPATLAAAGIGGMVINVNIAGGIASDLDADLIGERIGAAVQNRVRGTI